MKKLLLYGLSLSLVFSLAACASKSAPSDADTATDAVQTDQSQDNQTDDLTQAISNVKQSESKETLTNEELIKVFEEAYSIALKIQDCDIETEYMLVEGSVDNLYPTKQLPADYKERYIDWRPLDDDTSDNQSSYDSTASDGSTDNNPNGGSGNTSSGGTSSSGSNTGSSNSDNVYPDDWYADDGKGEPTLVDPSQITTEGYKPGMPRFS